VKQGSRETICEHCFECVLSQLGPFCPVTSVVLQLHIPGAEVVVTVGMHQVAKLLLEFFFAEQVHVNHKIGSVVVVVFCDNAGARLPAIALESKSQGLNQPYCDL
jgi:hypothetical protein